MNRTNQGTVIKEAISSYLDKGITDKQALYTKVVDDLGVPRPTVRRVARDLKNELLEKVNDDIDKSFSKQVVKDLRDELLAKIKILQSDAPRVTIAQKVK